MHLVIVHHCVYWIHAWRHFYCDNLLYWRLSVHTVLTKASRSRLAPHCQEEQDHVHSSRHRELAVLAVQSVE